MTRVDVVVVSYNSSRTLRDCVEPLSAEPSINVIVVDNASQDGSTATLSDLLLTRLNLERNYGFAYGCNRGWEAGSSPYVLFLNPDARLDPGSVLRLASVLDDHPSSGLVAPRIMEPGGSLELSIRRFPRLRSTYSRAIFLHRVFPHSSWADEDVWDPNVYESPREVEWVSGACMLVRRAALARIGGWDEGFFHYGSDVDLCRRLWSAGYRIRFEPAVTAVHIGGVSAPRPHLRPLMAASRVRYARKHQRPPGVFLERLGLALEELTHSVLTKKGAAARAGHRRALRTVLSRQPDAGRSARVVSVPSGVEPDMSKK